MPSLKELTASKYLTKEDAGPGMLVTIAGCESVEMQQIGQAPESKYCLSFRETPKLMVLNPTNRDLLLGIFPIRDHTNEWIDHKIVLFNDQTVFFQGKRGGLRIRAPKAGYQAAGAPAPQQFDPGARAWGVGGARAWGVGGAMGGNQRMQAEDVQGGVPIPRAGSQFSDFQQQHGGQSGATPAPLAPEGDGLPF